MCNNKKLDFRKFCTETVLKMASGSSLMSLTSICEGCLSVDRKLQTILHEESRKLYYEILNPLVGLFLTILISHTYSILVNESTSCRMP